MSPIPTKTPRLMDVETGQPQAQALEPAGGGELAAMFDRFLSDPNASVEKIERLMALWERNEARKSEAAFNAAMSAAQKEMRPVAADAFNPQTKSRYASYEALDTALRPIYSRHGFALSFNTGDAATDMVQVLCYVTHTGGHTRTYKADMPADGKGAKGGDVMTRTHATGSAMSYGQRYLLKLIFNVAVGDDDDGNRASARTTSQQQAAAPAGYDEFLLNMTACADEGWPKLSKAFGDAPEDYRKRLTGTDREKWEALKARAQKATKGGAK